VKERVATVQQSLPEGVFINPIFRTKCPHKQNKLYNYRELGSGLFDCNFCGGITSGKLAIRAGCSIRYSAVFAFLP